jgi:hypothetical protein
METGVSADPTRLVFPGEPNAQGERGPIDADKLLRNILRRALRRAGLPPLRFHDMRHLSGTPMSEARRPAAACAGDPRPRGCAHDACDLHARDAAPARRLSRQMAELAGLSNLGNKWETSGSVEGEESELTDCFYGSPGWNRTNDQRINSPTLYR